MKKLKVESRLVLILVFVSFFQINFAQNKLVLHYATDEYMLTSEQKEELKTNLAACDKCAVKIEGHTDSDASNTYNQQLSDKRSNEVYEYLKLTSPQLSFNVRAFGESDPLLPNESETHKAKNRRVVVTWTNEENMKEIVLDRKLDLNESCSCKNLSLNDGSVATDANLTTLVTTENDVVFTFPENDNKASYEITETTNQEEMLENKLNTMTADGVLESRYMYCAESATAGTADSFFVSLPRAYFEEEKRGWYVEKEGQWVDLEINTEDYFQDSCACYVMTVSTGCYNVDKPTPITEDAMLMAKYDARTKVKSYLFGLFNKYETLEPTFYFFPEGLNAGVSPSLQEKKKVVFDRYNVDWTGEIVAIATYKGKTFRALQEINPTNYNVKRDKMKFEKLDEKQKAKGLLSVR